MSKPMQAARLSAILFGILGLLTVVLIGGSVFAATLILKKSTEATHAQINAEVSANEPTQLQQLKDYLATNAADIQQTETLTQNIGHYDQSQVISTITQYANTAGVKISGINFDSGPTTASPATTGAATTTPTTAPVTAADSNTYGISLATPVQYRSFITFLKLLENGLMPVTITNGIITADPENPTTDVIVTSLTVKVAQ